MPESASSSTSAFSSLGATVSADARQRVENAASLASSAVFSSQFIGVQGAGADDLDAEDNGSSVSADKREASHDFEDAVDDDEASVSPQTGESVSVAAAGESTSNSIVASAASPAVIPDLSSALPSEQAINQFVDSVSGLKACGSNENDQSVFAAAASDSGDLPPAPPSTSSYLGSMVSTLSSAVVSAYSTARSSISALPASLPAMPAMPAMPSIPSMASYAPMSSMLPDVRALVASYAPQYAADWVEAERSVAKITCVEKTQQDRNGVGARAASRFDCLVGVFDNICVKNFCPTLAPRSHLLLQ